MLILLTLRKGRKREHIYFEKPVVVAVSPTLFTYWAAVQLHEPQESFVPLFPSALGGRRMLLS